MRQNRHYQPRKRWVSTKILPHRQRHARERARLTRITFVGTEEKPEPLVAEYHWHVLEINGAWSLRVK